MKREKLSPRGARIVAALEQLAADLEEGIPLESKYTVRRVRVLPEAPTFSPAHVRAVRERVGASLEVFAQLLAVSPMTLRAWEQGRRTPSPIARRFLGEIEMAPEHFRGRILAAGIDSADPAQSGVMKKATARASTRAKGARI